MMMKNSKFILALVVIFLSSCAPLVSNELSKGNLLELDQGSLLIDSETFIADQKDQVRTNAETTPGFGSNSATETFVKKNRRQIDEDLIENLLISDQLAEANIIFNISVNFQNLPIHDMALMFAEATGVNIIVGEEVSGLVTAKLEDVPWNRALDSILKIKKLAKHVDPIANIIRIHSQEEIILQEAYEAGRIITETTVRLSQLENEPLFTEIFKLYYTDAAIVSAEIESIINGESSEDKVGYSIEMTIDKRLNYIIAKANMADLDLIEKLINELDVRTKQILIEAFIVEAAEDLGKALGADFGITAPNAEAFGIYESVQADGTDGDPRQIDITGAFTNKGTIAGNALGLILGTSTKNLSIALAASETKGITKILSNPRVFTLDGEVAEIKQVDQIPYTKVEDGVTSIELKEAGITLKVTPKIVGDGNIILTVAVEKSTVDTTIANPPIAKRTITTKLLIQDQTIVVIGGVFTQSFKNSKSQTPLLGDLPFIGNLFKKVDKTDVRKEILVFLAPTVI